jgi:hypothetical protein
MACHLPAPLFRPAFPRAAARAFALAAAVCLSLAVSVAGPSGVALAQPVPPPKLEPLPEIPPPPELATDPDLEPQVTITRKDGETVEEARVGGKVVWIKVTPRHGRPYFLVPDSSGQLHIRSGLDTGIMVPLWVLFTF